MQHLGLRNCIKVRLAGPHWSARTAGPSLLRTLTAAQDTHCRGLRRNAVELCTSSAPLLPRALHAAQAMHW
jgi:hypothetical protein